MANSHQTTLINKDIGSPVCGYMLNSNFDAKAVEAIAQLQKKIVGQFGPAVWIQPPETLHITLMDWLAPLVDYGQQKEVLFKQLFPQYDQVLSNILKDVAPIRIMFDTVAASPGAIIVRGHDNGAIQRIRDRFTDAVDLLPNTKQPPTIIHSSIGRYTQQIPVEPICDFVAQQELSFVYELTEFQLVQETVAPMLAHQLVKTYSLQE